MTAPRCGTAAELDTPPRRALARLTGNCRLVPQRVIARGRERVSFALDHATPGHGRQPGHPSQTSRHAWAGAGHRDPNSPISSTPRPTATERPFACGTSFELMHQGDHA